AAARLERRSGVDGQGTGYVIAIATALLYGVCRREPLASGIAEHRPHQGWLGGIGSASMVRRVCSEPVPHGGQGLGVDQCSMLPGIELTFVRNPTGVNRV